MRATFSSPKGLIGGMDIRAWEPSTMDAASGAESKMPENTAITNTALNNRAGSRIFSRNEAHLRSYVKWPGATCPHRPPLADTPMITTTLPIVKTFWTIFRLTPVHLYGKLDLRSAFINIRAR